MDGKTQLVKHSRLSSPRLDKKPQALESRPGHCRLLQTPGLGGTRAWRACTLYGELQVRSLSGWAPVPNPAWGYTRKVLCSEASEKQDRLLAIPSPPGHSHNHNTHSPTLWYPGFPLLQS